MFSRSILSRSTLLAAVIGAVALFASAPRTANAMFEYEAYYYSYYGFLYSYYAAVYENSPYDNFHDQANYFGQYGYKYSQLGYVENDKSWFYYGYQYNGFSYSYQYQAYVNHGGSYTSYSADAFRSAFAYSYIAYEE